MTSGEWSFFLQRPLTGLWVLLWRPLTLIGDGKLYEAAENMGLVDPNNTEGYKIADRFEVIGREDMKEKADRDKQLTGMIIEGLSWTDTPRLGNRPEHWGD